MTDPGDELVEEVDETGAVVRVVTRREIRARNLRHRNVGVFVQRGDGAIVVHQRAPWKDIHPSLWDIAFGGVPDVGESDRQAAIRELREEAGLSVDPASLIDLGGAVNEDSHTRWVAHFFAIRTDAELSADDGEVVQMEEVPVAEIESWAETHPLCPDMVPLVRLVLEQLG